MSTPRFLPKMFLTMWYFAIAAMPWTAQAGPITVLGNAGRSVQPTPMEQIDHSPWTALLQKYVDERGMVNYAQWKASPADMAALDAYINQLAAATFDRNTTRAAQIAFWINAYNAVTVKGILREYPTTSIRNHTAKLFGYNIWKDLQLRVAGRDYSLDAMEHEVLRKMGEPRIHFAIVCASIGCPRLLNEAYTADRLDEQLSVNAKAFFSDNTKFSVDTRSGTITLSPILDWFGEDFGSDIPTRLRTIAPYLPASAQKLATSGSARVKFADYDWGLNDQTPIRR